MENLHNVLEEAMDLLTDSGKEHTLENMLLASFAIKQKYLMLLKYKDCETIEAEYN
jgi:hypothetical protein